MASSPEQLFDDQLAREPGRPFVTFYDGSTGERAELSMRSLANWVAKTHFLLVDELGLGVGDRAAILLPQHWLSVPVLLGCLTAGLTLVDANGLGGGDADTAVAFVEPETVAAARAVPDVYAIAPASPAVGFGDAVPDGAADYVASVRPQPDKWPTVRFGGTDSTAALDGVSRADLVERARARASALGMETGARVMSARAWSAADDWVDTLFAPLAVGGSVVYVRGFADPAGVDRVATQERVTVRL